MDFCSRSRPVNRCNSSGDMDRDAADERFKLGGIVVQQPEEIFYRLDSPDIHACWTQPQSGVGL
jgi:hypothetical protein